jgi:hypothetical protein
MSKIFTISEIEQAINYWRVQEAPGMDGALCATARILADVYGRMIYHRAASVDISQFSPEQVEAIPVALSNVYLPPDI